MRPWREKRRLEIIACVNYSHMVFLKYLNFKMKTPYSALKKNEILTHATCSIWMNLEDMLKKPDTNRQIGVCFHLYEVPKAVKFRDIK